MTRVVHVVVGPEHHGVVRHGLEVAAACGHRVVRAFELRPVTAAELDGADVVHVPFTDRLFGDSIESAVAAVGDLAATVTASGAALSVTLHDLPHDDSELQRRRRAGYRAVVALARGVVVNSEVELELLTADTDAVAHAASVRMIRLPVFDRVPPGRRTPSSGLVVGVLGFVYPDRGYEDVVRAAPAGSVVRAVGRPAAGHDHLVGELTDFARSRDISFEVTGRVDEADLPTALADVDVPVAPNRRVTASASINTWAEHGRRVLVPDGPYTRELRRERPERLVTYGGERELAAAIAAARDEPDSTRLPDDAATGPGIAEVAAAYRAHLVACRPPRAVAVAGGWTVPGNRWDLLAERAPATTPAVSVVVPYYRDQAGLDRLLAALAGQTHPRTRLEVVVADDGSPEPPSLRAAASVRARVVRQDDRGFRAAAARNLGAAAADGDVLVFLDGDMVPEPEFVARLCALPAVCPDAVTVGRRRHADLGSWTAADVTRWSAGEGPAPGPLPEPQWLSSAYAGSRDLLDADLRSYRFVISAVLALGRALFTEVGGFDESFTRYGGEDWELTHRLWTAGAVLAHRPDAIAWHDGPDWARRTTSTERAADKAAESAALAEVLPDPVERGGGQWGQPAVIVRLAGTDVAGLRATVRSAAHVDCGFWHADPAVATQLADVGVRPGEPPEQLRGRAGFRARVPVPADLRDLWQWCLLADRVGTVVVGPVQVDSTRYARRERRHGLPTGTLAGRHDRPWGVY